MPVPSEYRLEFGNDPWSTRLIACLDAIWDGMGLDGGGYKMNVPGPLNATALSVGGIPVGSSTDTYWEAMAGGIAYGASAGVGNANVAAEDANRDSGLAYGAMFGFFNKIFSWYNLAAGAGNLVDAKIGAAIGNTNICTANDSFVCGNRNVVGRRQWGIYDDGGSQGVDDPGLGVGNRAYVIIADKYGDVTGFFPNAQFDAAKVLACYGAGATIDNGNIYASGYTAPVDLTWAMHPYMIVRDAAVETGITLIKILKATYTGGVGTKIWYDSPTELYAAISFVYGSYSPVVAVYGIQGGNGHFGGGRLSSTWGYGAGAVGTLTRAWNKNAFAQGFGAEARGEGSFAAGYYCNADAYHAVVFGRYNVGGGTPGSWVDADPIYEIGNGASAGARSNAFTVLKAGRTGINTAVPAYALDVVGLPADSFLGSFSHAKTDALLQIKNTTAANVNNTAGIFGRANTDTSVSTPWQIYGGFSVITHASRTSTLKFLTFEAGAQVEPMRFLGGKTGFGTAAPAAKVAINGGLNVGADTDPGDNNIYVVGDCSALTFTDRTPHFRGDALAALKGIKEKKNGQIDHDTLPEFARRVISLMNGEGQIFETPGRDIGAMVSIHTVAIQQLNAQVETLLAKAKLN